MKTSRYVVRLRYAEDMLTHAFIEKQLPYRSRVSPGAMPWTDSASFRGNNCVANPFTNGVDLYAKSDSSRQQFSPANPQRPFVIKPRSRKHHVNALLDAAPLEDVELPPGLIPPAPLNGSAGVAQFFMLNDSETGVLTLGSFSASSYDELQKSLLVGLSGLQERGATRLIVDVVRRV